MKEIGGYFELELPKGKIPSLPGVPVNSGRHALEYILRAYGPEIKVVWLPYYTCDVMLEPIERLGLKYRFYHVNSRLEADEDIELDKGDCLIVNNYFGIKDRYVAEMAEKYGNRLIIDNAQAWYASVPKKANVIYSPRKFFGLPDGGVAFTANGNKLELPQGFSYNRCSHLMKRLDCGAEFGYRDFNNNSDLIKEEGLTKMSKLTERLLYSIDFKEAKERRLANFTILHNVLKNSNRFEVPESSEWECPMVYPYMTNDVALRDKLIANKVFVARYWPNIKDWAGVDSFENSLTESMLPLPIDQRYDEVDMETIIRLLGKE